MHARRWRRRRGHEHRNVVLRAPRQPEENEQVVAEVTAESPEWRAVSGRDALARHLRDGETAEKLFGADGFFRTFPPEHRTDGFFAAVLERG